MNIFNFVMSQYLGQVCFYFISHPNATSFYCRFGNTIYGNYIIIYNYFQVSNFSYYMVVLMFHSEVVMEMHKFLRSRS